MLTQFLSFADTSPFTACFLVVVAIIFAAALVEAFIKLFYRVLRVVTIVCRGYPNGWCDADGDVIIHSCRDNVSAQMSGHDNDA